MRISSSLLFLLIISLFGCGDGPKHTGPRETVTQGTAEWKTKNNGDDQGQQKGNARGEPFPEVTPPPAVAPPKKTTSIPPPPPILANYPETPSPSQPLLVEPPPVSAPAITPQRPKIQANVPRPPMEKQKEVVAPPTKILDVPQPLPVPLPLRPKEPKIVIKPPEPKLAPPAMLAPVKPVINPAIPVPPRRTKTLGLNDIYRVDAPQVSAIEVDFAKMLKDLKLMPEDPAPHGAASVSLKVALEQRAPFDFALIQNWLNEKASASPLINEEIQIAGTKIKLVNQPQFFVQALKTIAVTRGTATVPYYFCSNVKPGSKCTIEVADKKYNIEVDIGLDWLPDVKNLKFEDADGQLCTTVICVMANLFGTQEVSGKWVSMYNEASARSALFLFTYYGYIPTAFSPLIQAVYSENGLIEIRRIRLYDDQDEEGKKKIDKELASYSETLNQVRSETRNKTESFRILSSKNVSAIVRALWELPPIFANMNTLYSLFETDDGRFSFSGGSKMWMQTAQYQQYKGFSNGSVVFYRQAQEPKKYKCDDRDADGNLILHVLSEEQQRKIYPDQDAISQVNFSRKVVHELTHALDAYLARAFGLEEGDFSISSDWMALSGWQKLEESKLFNNEENKLPNNVEVDENQVTRLVQEFELMQPFWENVNIYLPPNNYVLPHDELWTGDERKQYGCRSPHCVYSRAAKGFVSSYAQVNPQEDLAETVENYFFYGKSLQEPLGTKYNFVKSAIFSGREYTRTRDLTLKERLEQIQMIDKDFSLCGGKKVEVAAKPGKKRS